jgi:alpha-tubulin suppressor-like RCC1 family protein
VKKIICFSILLSCLVITSALLEAISLNNSVLAEANRGDLYSWGRNRYGQIGNGEIPGVGETYWSRDVSSPYLISGDGDWQMIATSIYSSFGIKNGELYAWGGNLSGQLGDGSTTVSLLPKKIGEYEDWEYINAGYWVTFGIRQGMLYGWGRNDKGQLGDSTKIDRYTPVQIGALNGWEKVVTNGVASLAIRSGELYAWGSNHFGQIGDSSVMLKGEVLSPVRVGESSSWTDVSIGQRHVLAINDGELYAWGENPYGQLGLGDNTNRIVPSKVGEGNLWEAIAAGGNHSLGILNGELYAWGEAKYHALGIVESPKVDKFLPTKISELSGWQDVGAGYTHSIAIHDNDLYSFGSNSAGQLGLGHKVNRSKITKVSDDKNWLKVFSDSTSEHTLAIKSHTGFSPVSKSTITGDCNGDGVLSLSDLLVALHYTMNDIDISSTFQMNCMTNSRSRVEGSDLDVIYLKYKES